MSIDYGQNFINDFARDQYSGYQQGQQQSQQAMAQSTLNGIPTYGSPQWDAYAKDWGFGQALQAGQVQAGPQFALNQNNRELLAQQLALNATSYQNQTGLLNQDYGTGVAKLGLRDQELNAQRESLARQPEYLRILHDLANQAFTQSADVQRRGLDSAATARGSFTAIGTNEGRTDISNQLANQLAQSDTRYNEQIASVADQNRMLDLQGQSLGLDRRQLKTELERGLERLGLSNQISIADLTSKLNSSSIEDQMLAQQIFNGALGSSDYYSQFAPTQFQDQYKIGKGHVQ